MNIKIAERLRPFSHVSGTYCLLPGSHLRFQIFFAHIRVHLLTSAEPQELQEFSVPIKGPVKDFTVQLDLEKACIHVWGKSAEGYFRYRIIAKDHSFFIKVEKGLTHWFPNVEHSEQTLMSVGIDRLSLGNHKSQDWDMVRRRGDLTEILPAWLRLGQFIQPSSESIDEQAASLLKSCMTCTKENASEAFQNLFYAGFEGILSPRLVDSQYQGFQYPIAPSNASAIILLTEGAKAIRSLFFRMVDNEFFILPRLPPQFHCGRFLHVDCGGLGLLDMEWSKKLIRRLVFHAQKNTRLNFHFSREISSFRLNGENYPVDQSIEVEKDQIYVFDRFQK